MQRHNPIYTWAAVGFQTRQSVCLFDFWILRFGHGDEEAAGLPYEDYVQAQVLGPAGIHNMQLGKTQLAERLPGEVRY